MRVTLKCVWQAKSHRLKHVHVFLMTCDIKNIPYFNLSSDIFINIFWVVVRQRSACTFISSVKNVPVTTSLPIFHERLFSYWRILKNPTQLGNLTFSLFILVTLSLSLILYCLVLCSASSRNREGMTRRCSPAPLLHSSPAVTPPSSPCHTVCRRMEVYFCNHEKL